MSVKWNVKTDKEIKLIIEEVLENLSTVLGNTLGPYGSTTIIEQHDLNHHMTKDGFSVLKKITTTDATRNSILKILRDISLNLVVKVGDGSTSAIIASYHIFKRLKDYMDNNPSIRKKVVIDEIKNIIYILEKRIYANRRDISDDLSELEQIASISSNNDVELGRIIKNLYQEVGRYGTVSVKLGKKRKTTYKVTKGFRVQANLMDRVLINDKIDNKSIMQDSYVLMVKGIIGGKDYIKMISTLIDEMIVNRNSTLTIISNGYDNDIQTYFKGLFLQNEATSLSKQLTMLYFPHINDTSEDIFDDLEMYLGCKYINQTLKEDISSIKIEDILPRLGFAKSIEAKYGLEDALFFEGRGLEINEDKLEERKKLIKHELRDIRIEHEESLILNNMVYDLEKRLINFTDNGIGTIYVGGVTEMERETNKYLVEDAIKACESSIKYGYNIGGNLIIPIVIEELLQQNDTACLQNDLLKIIYLSFKDVFHTVYNNKFGNKTDDSKFDDIFNSCITNKFAYNLIENKFDSDNIINSCRTDVEIMKTTLSIISLLLSSNQFINIIPSSDYNIL